MAVQGHVRAAWRLPSSPVSGLAPWGACWGCGAGEAGGRPAWEELRGERGVGLQRHHPTSTPAVDTQVLGTL